MRAVIPYVHRFKKRGKVRYYYRRRGYPYQPLPGKPGSPEFIEAYAAAGVKLAAKPAQPRSPTGSASAVIAAHYADNSFLALAPQHAKNAPSDPRAFPA
jgi:hypothetical protein